MTQAKSDFTESADPAVVAAAAAKAIQESFRPSGTITDEEREGATQLERHKVLIVKDPMTKIQTDVFAYELPILYAIYGEDGIEVQDEFTSVVDVAGFDADLAYDRLFDKWGKPAEVAIKQIYPQGAYSLAQECGVASDRPRGAQIQRQKVSNLEIDHAVDDASAVAKQEARILPPRQTKTTKTAAPAKETAKTAKGKGIAAKSAKAKK